MTAGGFGHRGKSQGGRWLSSPSLELATHLVLDNLNITTSCPTGLAAPAALAGERRGSRR